MTRTFTVHPSSYRSKTGLRPYDLSRDFEHQFPPDEVRHDRIKVRVLTTAWLTPSADVEAIFHNMGPRDSESLFRATARGRGDLGIDLVIPARPPRFLLSGKGKADHNVSRAAIETTLELDLNPTRFRAHQPDDWDPEADHRNPLDALRLNASVRTELASITLDGNDNVLTGLHRLGGTTFSRRASQWLQVLEAYFRLIEEAIRADFAPTSLGVRAFDFRMFLRQAECYWEFQSPQAIADVARAASAISHLDGATSIYGPLSRGGVNNLRWVKLRPNAASELKIYAKMPDRIRIELSFLSRIPQFLSRTGRPAGDTAASMLMTLGHTASSAVRSLWTDMARLLNSTEDPKELITFLSALNRSVPAENLQLMLQLLIHHHGLNAAQDGTIISKSVCDALVRERVLFRVRGRRDIPTRYRVSDSYLQLLQRLETGAN